MSIPINLNLGIKKEGCFATIPPDNLSHTLTMSLTPEGIIKTNYLHDHNVGRQNVDRVSSADMTTHSE